MKMQVYPRLLFQYNVWRVSEVFAEDLGEGSKPEPDTRLLSECVSTEASVRERRVTGDRHIFTTLIHQ